MSVHRDRSSGTGRLRIAVVGSGLAGLTATWLLGRRADVTVFEQHPRPGMGAHSIRLANGGPLVDVPLRVFTPAYYPRLIRLYRETGIRIAGVDYAASFSRLGGETYFAYRNLKIGRRRWPWIPPSALLSRRTRALVPDLLRLLRTGPKRLRAGALEGRSLGEWLDAEGYGPEFVDGFLLPTYAAVCTCSLESVRRYPAEVIVRYFCSGVATIGVMRAEGGSEDVARRLIEPATEVRTDTPVRRIHAEGDGVRIVDGDGASERFDHVVLAARADEGAALLEGDPTLSDLLRSVPHEESRILVHTDPALAPADTRSWRPVNLLVADDEPAPMATIWLNPVQTGLEHEAPIFQTWNPLLEPDPDTVLTEARVSRPVVTVATREVPTRLAALNEQRGRRVWPVGSYADSGIPLLEAAASSAIRVAERLVGI